MYQHFLVPLLIFYGIFLISCGIIAITFIGMKAKTALISGGTSGCTALVCAYLNYTHSWFAPYTGIFLCIALFVVFSWRSTKTLFRMLEMIQTGHEEIKGKGIAFLIISLMAVITLFVLALQIIFFVA